MNPSTHRGRIVEIVTEDEGASGVPYPNVIHLDRLWKFRRIGHATAPVFELSADDRELGAIRDVRGERCRRNAIYFENQRCGRPFQPVHVSVLAGVGSGGIAVVPGTVVVEQILIHDGQIPRYARLDFGNVNFVVGIGPGPIAPIGVPVHDRLASGAHRP